MRLIDADINVYDYVETWYCTCSDYGRQRVMAVDDLSYLPTINAVPVMYGKWIKTAETPWNTQYQCSICNTTTINCSCFCPNCGANMNLDGDKK